MSCELYLKKTVKKKNPESWSGCINIYKVDFRGQILQEERRYFHNNKVVSS